MTSLLEGARKLVTRSSDIGARIDGPRRRGRRCPRAARRRARRRGPGRRRPRRPAGCGSPPTTRWSRSPAPPGRASRRRSTPLTGLDLSAVGVRRPTTSWATACVWGTEGADRAARVARHPAAPPGHPRLDARHPAGEDNELDGVVLLDLPDHDSTEVSHHLEVDRLVQLADLLVWVLDPQKYADAAIHDRYLAPLRRPTRT